MSTTGTFDNSFDVGALGALVGIPLRFTTTPADTGLDDVAVDLCGVLQGVAVEERGQLKELKFYFFNQVYTVQRGESYSIAAL